MALQYVVTKRVFGFDKTNTEKYVEPTATNIKIESTSIATYSIVKNHPQLATIEAQQNTAFAQTQLEKAKKLPMLSV